jgi:hypothetical protein
LTARFAFDQIKIICRDNYQTSPITLRLSAVKKMNGTSDSPRQEGEYRYLDTSEEDHDGDDGTQQTESRSMPENEDAEDNAAKYPAKHRVFAVMADQFVKTTSEISDNQLQQQTSEFQDAPGIPAVAESSSFDDNFALFGRDKGIEVVNLDPSDSEGADDDDSRSSDSEISPSQSMADHAKKMGMEKSSRQFSAHLSSIDRDNAYGGDSSDDSDRLQFFTNYGLGSLSVSSPSGRASGARKGPSKLGMTMGKAPTPRLQVLTPEEKRRKREEAVRKREAMQLSQCTFRSIPFPRLSTYVRKEFLLCC